MLSHAKSRTLTLQTRMRELGIDRAVFTDESSIAYLAGFWGYLGIEFGRPSMLIVDAHDAPTVITPLMESEMVTAMTWVENIRKWEDFGDNSWARALQSVLGDNPKSIWIERDHIPAIVRNFLDETYPSTPLENISPILGAQRMIKSDFEINIMRQAGEIAGAMMAAAHGLTGHRRPRIRKRPRRHQRRLTQGRNLPNQYRLGSFRIPHDPQPTNFTKRQRRLNGSPSRQH